MGRFEFTPITPPTAPAAISRSSFFISGNPPTAAEAAITTALNMQPHIIPSIKPRRLRNFPHIPPAATPPQNSEITLKCGRNIIVFRTKKVSSENIMQHITVTAIPTADDAAKLKKVFDQRLGR